MEWQAGIKLGANLDQRENGDLLDVSKMLFNHLQ